MLLRHRQNPLVRQALSYGLGTTLYKLHIVLLVPLFAFAFDAEEAGRLEIALFGAGLVSALSAANLNQVVSQRYTQSSREDRPFALGLGVVTTLVVAAGGVGFAAILSIWFVAGAPELEGRETLVVLALAGGALNALVGNLCVYFQLKSLPRAFNIVYAMWASIVLVGTFVYVLGIERRAESFAIATLCAGVICSVAAVARFRTELGIVRAQPESRALVRRTLSLDLRRSARLFPVIILGWALLFLDRKLLSSAAGVAEVGVYGLAVRVANGITLVLGPLGAAWWDAAMNQGPDEARATLRRSIRAHAVVMLACVIGAILIAQGPLPSLLGDWFGPGVRYLPVLVVCATLISTYIIPCALLTRDGRYGYIIGAHVAAVSVNVALNLLLDREYGAAGASAANLLAYLALNAVAIWPVRHEVAAALGGTRRSVMALMGAGCALALAALTMPSAILTGY